MALSPQEVIELKMQLKQQVQHLPEDQRKLAEKQIDEMSSQAIEEMLRQQQERSSDQNQKTIFRMIVDKDVDSLIAGENSEALAVYDINPISEGHLLIIPKKEVKSPAEIPKLVFSLAEELSKRIIDNLKAKEVKAETEIKFGEAVLNLIPIYSEDLNVKSRRKKSNIEELEKIKKKVETIKLDKKVEKIKIETKDKKEKSKINKPIKLQRRIP